MSLNDALHWRYAAKRLNGDQVPEDTLERIMDAARLAPSSFGLHPWSLVHVRSHELRARLHEKAAPQPQVIEGSDLLILAVHDRDFKTQVDEHIAHMARTRGQDERELDGFRDMVKGVMDQKGSHEACLEWAARQAYIGLGMILSAAALERVDASPMEGFYPEKLDEALGLGEKGLKSVVMVALGYRDTERDPGAEREKVRRDREHFVVRLP
ncbi:nitroreductase family protein [Kushneria konosiri]|uniref:NAD(P)H-dependent oxidoreductase n=1 Tax=Kushneria konosiri TaxID=698828 RepID=A0A2Z2H5B9_9GAMM|nr:nitroreductase family protein [Kushneria konosiri]ARS52562.1 NAD(P)H-dependent oxidoreductase [Kushneria konosiri]